MLVDQMDDVGRDENYRSLMISVRDRDCRDSFERLVRRWQPPVQRYCYRLCGNVADAEDLSQEIFQKLYDSRRRYQPSARFNTFLWTIATNHCRDFARLRRRQHQSSEQIEFDSTVDTRTINLDDQSRSDIQSTVWKLPLHYREVIVLRHYEGLQFAEIAELLNLPRGTVASRMAKALRILESEFVRLDLLSRGRPRVNPPNPTFENGELSAE